MLASLEVHEVKNKGSCSSMSLNLPMEAHLFPRRLRVKLPQDYGEPLRTSQRELQTHSRPLKGTSAAMCFLRLPHIPQKYLKRILAIIVTSSVLHIKRICTYNIHVCMYIHIYVEMLHTLYVYMSSYRSAAGTPPLERLPLRPTSSS